MIPTLPDAALTCPEREASLKERGPHVPSDGVSQPLSWLSLASATNLPFHGIVSLEVFIEYDFALGSPPPVCSAEIL